MYPSVEIVTALRFVACYLSFGLTAATAKWLFFSGLLVVLIVTDYRDRILPDEVNWFGVGLGLTFAIRSALRRMASQELCWDDTAVAPAAMGSWRA